MLRGLLPSLIMMAVTLIGMGAAIATVFVYRWRQNKELRHSPLTQDMLRAPGHSLRAKIEDADIDVGMCFTFFLMIPLTAYAVHITQSYFLNEPESRGRTAFTVFMAILFLAAVSWRLVAMAARRRKLILGLEGELATGEELNQLMLEGCRVFHDVPTRWGNIDHVVVSESGVFTVETKMRGKPKRGENVNELVVDNNRGTIRFPDYEWKIPVGQMESQAKWLADCLTSAIGERVAAEPILALPGWFVRERIGRSQVMVINPKKPLRFFLNSRRNLSPKMIQTIAHQLEQLCRDVKPRFREQPTMAEKRA